MILDEVFRAIGYLIIGGIICFAWKKASDEAIAGRWKMVLWKGFLWCVGIAFFAGFTLGNPTCLESEQDMHGTICLEYANDGYTPTIERRAAKFSYYMTLLYVPVIFGAIRHRHERESESE